MIDEERIYGDGVNLAARIQALAEPGEIYITEGFYKHIGDKLNFQFIDIGEKELKNFKEPIRVYRIDSAHDMKGQPYGFTNQRSSAAHGATAPSRGLPHTPRSAGGR